MPIDSATGPKLPNLSFRSLPIAPAGARWFARAGMDGEIQRIICAVDGSRAGEQAAHQAVMLARAGSQLHVVAIDHTLHQLLRRHPDLSEERLREALDQAVAAARAAGVQVSSQILRGRFASQILLEEHCATICWCSAAMGTPERRELPSPGPRASWRTAPGARCWSRASGAMIGVSLPDPARLRRFCLLAQSGADCCRSWGGVRLADSLRSRFAPDWQAATRRARRPAPNGAAGDARERGGARAPGPRCRRDHPSRSTARGLARRSRPSRTAWTARPDERWREGLSQGTVFGTPRTRRRGRLARGIGNRGLTPPER